MGTQSVRFIQTTLEVPTLKTILVSHHRWLAPWFPLPTKQKSLWAAAPGSWASAWPREGHPKTPTSKELHGYTKGHAALPQHQGAGLILVHSGSIVGRIFEPRSCVKAGLPHFPLLSRTTQKSVTCNKKKGRRKRKNKKKGKKRRRRRHKVVGGQNPAIKPSDPAPFKSLRLLPSPELQAELRGSKPLGEMESTERASRRLTQKKENSQKYRSGWINPE